MESVNWTQEQMLEVELKEPDDFLKIRETLSRIGVASRKEKVLYQSCHILHKQGKYYIVHFKELFALDGKETNLSDNDNNFIVVKGLFLIFINDLPSTIKESFNGLFCDDTLIA